MNAAWQTPIVILALMGSWLVAPPRTLGEASQREAFRRQLAGKSRVSLTNLGQPLEIPLVPPPPPASADQQAGAAGAPPAAAAGAAAAPIPADKVKDEKFWRDRIATAQDRVNRDAMMIQALQTRINTLKRDSVNLDDPNKQKNAREELQKMMDELDRTQKSIEQSRKAIVDIQDEARRLNVPAGWVRAA